MDTEKIQRNKGDLNLNLKVRLYLQQYQNELIVDDKSNKYSSFNTINDPKTKSLTLLSINQDQIDLYDVIPYYNDIKSIIFDSEFDRNFIYSEMREFNNIEEIKNQRILIEKNNQSSVLSVMDNESQQLMVIKRIETFSLENSIQKFDEYKIHYNINLKYPETSLKLFTPVKIQKQSQLFTIQAFLERAQFNLYDYSRKFQITKEHAYYILIQILQQIINMHSINIAHRDVKPQNIFYVKDKGWLLSDFGESQEYQEVDSLYNVRGTVYFLKSQLKQELIRNRILTQNLLIYDIYALVVSIIIIQQQQYITDIQEIIQQENDQVLKDLLQINQLDTLKKFFEDLKLLLEKKFHINDQKPIYKQLNPHQIKENNQYLQQSWMHLYRNFYKNNIHPSFMNQLLQLIKNIFFSQQIMQLKEKIIYSVYELVFDGINIVLEQPLHLLKHFNKYNLNQQKILVKLLFQFGLNEKTIYYANRILKYNYCQELHLIIIFCQRRNYMHENCRNELLLFNQQLQLDQLDSFYLYEYLDMIRSAKFIDSDYQRLNSLNFLKNAKRIIQQPPSLIELLNQNQQNEKEIVNMYIKHLVTYCGGNYMFQKDRFASEAIIIAMQRMPLNLYKQFVCELNKLYLVVIDQNKKVALLTELEQIFDLLNQKNMINQNLKKIKTILFNPDSDQQAIRIIMQINLIKIRSRIGQKRKFNYYFQNIKQIIKKFELINILKYQIFSLLSLFNLIQILSFQQIKNYNHDILYLIKFSIKYAQTIQYHLKYPVEYQIYHRRVQVCLYKLRNYKRISSLIENNDIAVINIYKNKIQINKRKESSKLELMNQVKGFEKVFQKKFLNQHYLERQ